MTLPDNPVMTNDTSSGPGQRLRMAREAQGLSLKDVASRLRLDVKQIEDIERNEFNNLMAPVFIRGYLRSYARLVNLSPDAVVKTFESQKAETPKVLHGKTASLTRSGDRAGSWIIYLLILGGLIGGGIWWQTQDGFKSSEHVAETNAALSSQAPVRAESTSGVAPTPAVSTDSTPATAAPPQTELQAGVATQGSTAQTSPDEAAPSAAGLTPDIPPVPTQPSPLGDQVHPPQASPPEEAAAIASQEGIAGTVQEPSMSDQQQGAEQVNNEPQAVSSSETNAANTINLVLKFSGDSWVEVINDKEERLLYKLMTSGTTQTLEGITPPVKVLLGNASAVTMEYNGQVFDHSRYNRNGVARFVLGAPENSTQP